MSEKKLTFHAIRVVYVIYYFFITLATILFFSEYIIPTLTKNTTLQTLSIIVIIKLLLAFGFIYEVKLSKQVSVYIKNNFINHIMLGNKHVDYELLKSINLIPFIHKKLSIRSFRVNKDVFLIYVPGRINKQEKEAFQEKKNVYKKKITQLTTLIDKSFLKRTNRADFLIWGFNVFFYLIFFCAVLSFLFLIMILLTDNTGWFNYFNSKKI